MEKLRGRRKQLRWENDHHIFEEFAFMEEEYEEDSGLSCWQKLAENEKLCEAFRMMNVDIQDKVHLNQNVSLGMDLYLKMEKKKRMVLQRGMKDCALYLKGMERVLVYFLKWGEVPMFMDKHVAKVLPEKLEMKDQKQLMIPCPNSGYHRLLIHSICQFYGLFSKSMSFGVVVEKKWNMDVVNVSLTHFLTTNEFQSCKSEIASSVGEDSDGYQMVDDFQVY